MTLLVYRWLGITLGSERLPKEHGWNRKIWPRLAEVELGQADSQWMQRTHLTQIADPGGLTESWWLPLRPYARREPESSSPDHGCKPTACAKPARAEAARHVNGIQMNYKWNALQTEFHNLLTLWSGRPGLNRRHSDWECGDQLKTKNMAFTRSRSGDREFGSSR